MHFLNFNENHFVNKGFATRKVGRWILFVVDRNGACEQDKGLCGN